MLPLTTLALYLHRALHSFDGLREAVGQRQRASRALIPLLNLVWGRLTRLLTRLDRLTRLWEADRLPTPRPRRPATPRQRPPPELRQPTGHGWLARLLGPNFGPAGVAALLQDPDARALFEAAPQAGRIFRPLCRLLGVDQPDWLRLPPRPRKPRAPKPPRPESRTAMIRRWRRMTGAELSAEFSPLPPHFNLPIPGYQAIRRKIRAAIAAGEVRPHSLRKQPE